MGFSTEELRVLLGGKLEVTINLATPEAQVVFVSKRQGNSTSDRSGCPKLGQPFVAVVIPDMA